MEPGKLADITSKFGPGVSILYGTFISLTLSILYERQRDIQNDAAVEASLLALITRNLLSIFRRDEDFTWQVFCIGFYLSLFLIPIQQPA